jgi:hypothetical protein
MRRKPWFNNAVIKGLDPAGGIDLAQVLNPDVELDWLTEEQRKNLLEFVRQGAEVTRAEQKEDREFEKALVKAARKEVAKAFDNPDKIEEGWTGEEFAKILAVALDTNVGCRPYGGGYRDPHHIELAETLGVEVPERLRKWRDELVKSEKFRVIRSDVLMTHKIDAIIKHFKIEVPEITDD